MPAKSTVQPALDEVAGEAHAKLDQAIDEFKERAQTVARETLDSLRTHAKPYVDRAKPYVDTAGEQFADAERYLVERVQKQPMTTTLAALGVGVLIGLVLASGRSR
jgi:ElaB/YqjD/DUF883 family membrane-anchored ribosome-binding protein